MPCTAGGPFLGGTHLAVLAEGCTVFSGPDTPPTAKPCVKIRIKPPEWASQELCSSLPCPSSNTELQKPRQREGRLWQPGPNTQHHCTCSVFRCADVQCDLCTPQTVPIVSFAPCGWVNVGFVHKVTSFKSPLPDWAGIRVQVLFYRVDGESLEMMSETRAYLIGWGDVAT